jgi:hypothetical protein
MSPLRSSTGHPPKIDERGGAMEDQEPRDADDGDELEADIMQADHAFGAESVGTTVEEELAGESLDQRLAEERPDRPSVDEALSVIDEGPSDDEGELVGEAVIERDEFASPEEAALSVRDSAPGATDHVDPHPADGDEENGA